MRLAVALLAVAAARAIASDEETAAGAAASFRPAPVLEEVIVTAQRREERLQEVPISASVFSTQQLERLQIDDLGELQFAAPNLSVAPSQTAPTSASIAMRGQFEVDTTPTVDPAVGLYLDGVYIARMTGANLDLVDLDRVEVLRGPQGTLFGRNTIGGAINLVPQRPTSQFDALLKARLGNYDLQEVTGFLNTPSLSGRIATRLTAMHSEHGGYAQNTLLGTDFSDADTDFARLQLQLAPAPGTQLNLAVDLTQSESGSQQRTMLAVLPGSELVTTMLGNPTDSLANYVDPYSRSVPANRAGIVESTVWGASATLTIEFAPLTFKSITAYRALDIRATDSDQDGTPYDLGVIFLRRDEQHQFSEELQLFGSARDDRLQWIGGLYYFDERGTFDQEFQIFVPATITFNENRPWGEASNHSLAAYAQLSFALTPRFRLTAGARYNEDWRQLTSRNARRLGDSEVCRIAPSLLDQPGVCEATRPERSFSYMPFTLAVEFSPTESALLYARISQGHRAGGYNLRGATEIDMDTFDPEQVDSYEIGTKADLFDERLRINLALFHTYFENIQLLQRESVLGVPTPRFIRNGGEARIDGGELEITALLGALRLAAALGVTRPRFTKLDPRVDGVTLDSDFLHTPESTVSIAADLPVAVEFGAMNLHADYSWRDDVPFAYDPHSLARQDAYGLLNAMLSASFDQTAVVLSLWARNITDEGYVTRAFDSDYYISASPGTPRTYGVSLACRFGTGNAAQSQ
ncbi:MAG TPA: TonB-dependent receptor [Gammaproteobacteria bacterium]|nr:TonB-dependent receptor [Gammaproteobacteria bacterium]